MNCLERKEQMNFFRVALLQMTAEKNQEENLKKGLAFCRQAKQMGADLALFPEMWNNGYSVNPDVEKLKQGAVSYGSPFVQAFRALAAELDMAVGITYLEEYDPLPRNTLTVFDRHGKVVLTYSKVHTCDFEAERNLTPGNDFYVADLNTATGNVKLGAMICYDREFPESARILMLKGAEVILVPNACPMEPNRLSQLRSRAFENMVGIATANYAIGQPVCNGHSSAFDGIAYGKTSSGCIGPRDTLVVEAGEEEGVYLAIFPMKKLRAYRSHEIHGNAYRHPQKYRLLISEAVEEPYLREDSRR